MCGIECDPEAPRDHCSLAVAASSHVGGWTSHQEATDGFRLRELVVNSPNQQQRNKKAPIRGGIRNPCIGAVEKRTPDGK